MDVEEAADAQCAQDPVDVRAVLRAVSREDQAEAGPGRSA